MGKGSDRRPETTEVPRAVVESEWERLLGLPPAVRRRLEREAAEREAAATRDLEQASKRDE